LLKAEF